MNARAARRIEALQSLSLAKPVEHGKRVSYMRGCRCLPCRAANARHASRRLMRRAAGQSGNLVSAETARQHILHLSSLGIGRRALAAASRVARSIIAEIRNGQRPNIRATTERRILAVDESARAGRSLISAAPTWRILDALIDDGYTKRQLASWLLGRRAHGLQINRRLITKTKARAVEQLAARIERGEMRRFS